MTDFRKLREEYAKYSEVFLRSHETPTRAILALLDRAIAEDADGVDVSTVSVDKKTHYMKAVAMGKTLSGNYRQIIVDDAGFVVPPPPTVGPITREYTRGLENANIILKAEIAALTRQLADERASTEYHIKGKNDWYEKYSREKARTERVARLAASRTWDEKTGPMWRAHEVDSAVAYALANA